MSFAHPLGLLALFAVPIVLGLHLFRRRLARREVAGLFLWAASAPRAEAGRRRTRLQRSASLLLELLAVAVAALWLAGPRLGVAGHVPHLVLVVDDSASMGALGVGAQPAAVAAARRARQLADGLPNDGVVTVIVSGPRPVVACGPRAPAVEVARVLQDWQPFAPSHDLLPALDLAREVGGAGAEIALLTDHDLRDLPPGVRVEAFGAPGPNAAILHARRALQDDGTERLFCDVTGFGGATQGRIVCTDQTGTEIANASFALDAAREHHATLSFARRSGVVRVALFSAGDSLPTDDVCELPEPRDRTVTVAVDLPDGLAQRVDLPRVVSALRGVAATADRERAHVRIAATPGTVAPGHHELVVGPCGEGQDAWVGPFLIDRRNPLVEGLTLDGVVWSAGRDAPVGEPLVLADTLPLVAIEALAGDGLRLHLNLDLARSNLAASPDWPILLANVAEYARARLPGIEDDVVPLGGVIRFRGDTAGVELVGADGSRRVARGVGIATWDAVRPGLFAVERGGAPVDVVAVHFKDLAESDLAGRSSFSRAAEIEPRPAADAANGDAPGRGEARILALALLALLGLDWWALRRSGGAA